MNFIYKIKSNATTLLLLSTLACSVQVSADGCYGEPKCAKRTYLRADVGGSILEFGKQTRQNFGKRADPSVVLAIGAGYEINNQVRTDLTLSTRIKYQFKDAAAQQSFTTNALMINGYYTITAATFSPYLMAGLGAAVLKAGDYIYADGDKILGKTSINFAWQVGAGLTSKINNSVSLDLGYKFVNLDVAKASDTMVRASGLRHSQEVLPNARMKSHELSVGVIYKF